jgi:hypothetical protein
MTKLINEPVKIYSNNELSPHAFTWRKRHYRISEVINWWRQPAPWDRDAIYLFLRVNATNNSTGTYELCRLREEWFLHRIID